MNNLKLENFCKEELSFDNSGHNIDHIKRVVSNAYKILEKEGGCEKIVITACYLHDLVDEKLFSNISIQDQKIINFLSADYTDKEIRKILFIIHHVSFHLGDKIHDDLDLEIVRDADRLDALGAIGIIRTIEYGNNKKRPFYENKNLKLIDNKIVFNEKTETSLSHFYDKLFKLKDLMYTKTAKEIAIKRDIFMRKFIEEFFEEIR